MEIKKIEKERIGDYPICPRAEYKGIPMDGEEFAKEDFVARSVEVEGLDDKWLIECQRHPYRTFQVFLPKDEQQFDDYLAKLRSMHETPAYIEGRLDFMVLFAGSKGHVEINQLNYKEVDREIMRTLYAACRWWAKYGEEVR